MERVSIVKDWGTSGIIYRSDKVKESPLSWQDFWTLQQQR
jgi:spermidine/putrescine-binding protein